MHKTENVIAGFWSKFLSRIIDLVIMSVIVVGIAFTIMVRNPKWNFDEPWKFYLWILIFFVVVSSLFLMLPMLWDGKTIGMFLLRIKVQPKEYSLSKSIFKREAFFSIMWILNILLVAMIINHTLINRYARTAQKGIQYTSWETARISIISSVGTITVMIQMLFAISSIVRKDKRSLHDVYSKTIVVKFNKTQLVKEVKSIPRKIKPKLIEEPEVKWIK